MLENFLTEYVRGSDSLRSADQVERAFKVYVRPRIGTKSIYCLQRSDIKTMLAEIAQEHGPVMADRVLAYVRKAFNWQMIGDDSFKSPIVRGMARTKPKQRTRKRILADEEIREVWTALEAADVPSCYPSFIRLLLLTVTRRNEASMLNSSELDGDLWMVPGLRYKTKLDHVIPLTESVRASIGSNLRDSKEIRGLSFRLRAEKNLSAASPRLSGLWTPRLQRKGRVRGRTTCLDGHCMTCAERGGR